MGFEPASRPTTNTKTPTPAFQGMGVFVWPNAGIRTRTVGLTARLLRQRRQGGAIGLGKRTGPAPRASFKGALIELCQQVADRLVDTGIERQLTCPVDDN